LSGFVEAAFQKLNPGSPYHHNWHIDCVAWYLEEVECGAIKRLIITLPPRYLKSFIASVAFPAWVLGQDPSKKIISISYSQDLVKNLSGDFRRVVDLPFYRELFPATLISRQKNTETEQLTTANGFRYATSIEGTLTGRGGNILIIDDPIKAGAVNSEAERTAVNAWFSNTVRSRLNSKRDDAIVVVMQRLHENDLVGHLTERDDHGWTVVNIPAIETVDTIYRIGNGAENRTYFRKQDEVLQESRETRENLAETKQDIGSYLFTAQYQGQPASMEGNDIKREWLRWYAEAPEREEFDAVVQSWDTAGVDGELNDFSVCTTWGVKGNQYYLLHRLRQKLDYPALRARAISLARHYRASIVLIEYAGTGISLRQEMRQAFHAYYPKRRPVGDKRTRVVGVTSLIEDGRVLLPQDALWKDEFLKEILGFPGGRHDDQVDSLVQFLSFMQFLRNGMPRHDPVTGRREVRRRDPIRR